MASDEASTDAAARAWQEYEMVRIKLEMKCKDELCFLLS
jgi:hypothetical protein